MTAWELDVRDGGTYWARRGRQGAWIEITPVTLTNGRRHYFTDNGRPVPRYIVEAVYADQERDGGRA